MLTPQGQGEGLPNKSIAASTPLPPHSMLERRERRCAHFSFLAVPSERQQQRLQERQMTRTQSRKTIEQNLSHETIKPNPGAGNSPPQARPVLHRVSEIAVNGLMCFQGSLWSDSSVLRQLCPSVLPFPNTSANKT